MYREIITPESREITLKIPAAYLNKHLEILVFEINEGLEQVIETKSPTDSQMGDLSNQMVLAKAIMAENVEVLSKLAQ